MLFSMIPMTLLTVLAEGSDGILVSIEPVTIQSATGGAGKPDASGYARFVIKASSAPTSNITVYYKTGDLSAIAESGDYEAQSGAVVLTPTAYEAQISIKTERTEHAVVYYDVFDGNWNNVSYTSRKFEVMLTDVVGDADIDSENDRAECVLNAEYTYEAIRYGPWKYTFSPYTSAADFCISNFLVTPAWGSGDGIYKKSIDVSFSSNWKQYLNSSVDAKLYIALRNAHIDESSWNSSTNVWVAFAGVSVNMQGEFHDNELFGWGSPFLFVDTGDKGKNGEHREAYTYNFRWALWTTYDGTVVRAVFRDEVTHDNYVEFEELLEKKYVIVRDTNPYWLSGGTDPSNYYLGIDESVLDWGSIGLEFDSAGGYSRRLTGGDLIFRLEDIYAPTVKENGSSYEVYHNLNTVKDGEKLRLAIRLNEPVQLNGKEPYISGKVNGKGTGALTDPYCVRFNYVGGDGTDTLYFEAEYDGNYLITSITDLTFVNAKSVIDFADVSNSLSIDKFSINNFTFDRRDPVISVENSDFSTSANPIKSTSIDVTVSNISEGATLYYTWTDSPDTPTSYDDYVSLNNLSIYETQTVTINVGGDGKKYLHLKAITKIGRASTYVFNNKTGISKDALGPYYFDNSAPTFSESVIPLSGESDMTQKVYMIPLPSDNPSGVNAGFYEMKIYCIMPDGQETVIKRENLYSPHGSSTHDVDAFITKDFTVDKDGKKYLKLTIEAADVGIGEKTRVENVSIYFTLTDSLGNTATNVSRHSVIFDTNEYIDVTAAGSSQSFADQTDKLEGENTLIYSNYKNVQSNGKTVYYSFEFKIKESTTNCSNTFLVIKRGETSKDDVVITDGYYIPPVTDTATGEKTVTIEFTSPIAPGTYDIQLLCYDHDSDQTEKADRVSETYRIYIGKGVGQLGEKINTGTLLINKVYQLPASSSFYYMYRSDDENAPETVESVASEYYNKNKLAMSFSSIEEARKFVLFNEYRDLYAVTLDKSLADALNSKTSSAQPAQGDQPEAKEGQVWIRYKSISWIPGSKQTSNWVYYYYGTSETLDPANFSLLLNEALNYVTNAITNTGKTVALTDLSLKNNIGETLVDEHGVPYLDPSQIVSSDLNLSDSKTKISEFSKEIRYTADSAIYSSKVVKSDSGIVREYSLVGHLTVPTGSRFQYRRYNSIGTGLVSDKWVDITVTPGTNQRFRDVILEGGWYEIRELGIDGTSYSDVYIDKSSPSVCISWKDKNGSTLTQWMSEESEKDFRAGTFQITAIDNNEADKYSYVAIYGMLNSELYGAYTVSELQKSSVTLPDGKYYMIVADRSGNSYYLSLYVNSSKMNCNVDEVENTKIIFTCDRDSTQIQSFYVKRNGVRIENVHYASMLSFLDSGSYEFYVEDIYGNTYSYKCDFSRDYPELEWSYLTNSGFTKYSNEKESNLFKKELLVDGSYKIITSTQIRFQASGDYDYAFIGEEPEFEKNNVQGYVTITEAQSFQLKVWYKSHPDVYTIYNCSADQSKPTINVSAQVYKFSPSEITAMNEALASGTLSGVLGTIIENEVSVSGKFLTPSTIAFLMGEAQTKYLVDGETILSDLIRINVVDENGLLKQEVYHNGELINQQTEETGFSDVILSRYGEYRIVAQDALGNTSEFVFKNASPDAFQYLVDGKTHEIGINDYKNFDSALNYTAVNYGNASVSFTVFEKMSVFYMITDTDGEQKFVAFDVDDGVIRSLRYFLRDGGSSVELVVGDVLFNAYDGKYTAGSEFVVYEDNGIAVLVKLDSNGDTVLTVYSKANGTITVDARLNTSDGEIYYNKTELSTIAPDLTIKVDGKVNEADTPDGQLNINKPFEIVTESFANENIASVEVYFSNLNDLDAGNLSGKVNVYGKEIYSDEGFYLVRAIDKYGNERIYRIHLSKDFEATPYVEFDDGQKIHYSPEYKKDLYSDSKIVFEIHSSDVTVTAKKNGSTFTPDVVFVDGVTYVTLDEEGEYTLSFADEYGNVLDYKAHVDFTHVNFNEKLLFGYNENALKKDEGYTNKKLSISESVLEEELNYLAVLYGDSLTVIYDAISEITVDFDSDALLECIGNSGDGEYKVIVRDKHGAMATKIIHYRATPTLKLERETRSSTKPEIYSLSDAESIGYWSNNTLIFTTEASEYVFKINDDKTECPKTISYATSGNSGRNEYDISYIDEYGFSYTFKAYLARQELSISESPTLNTQYVNDVLTTKDDISVTFSEGAICTYTLNHSEQKLYSPGEKLTADGVYRFTVSDYAGNVSTFTIKKDTISEFYFKTNKSPSIQNGEVVNNSKVDFVVSNNDSAYIEKVLRNGVVQSDFTGSTFVGDGRWEVIISDMLGNKAYFSFYIISREQNGFAYTTPYEYHITELWYDDGDGVKTTYMSFVNHTDFSSSFDLKENGKYTVTMMSDVTGAISTFEFTVNTIPPKAYLVGCNEGETTINDVTIAGYKVGDRIKIYKATDMGEKLVKEVEVTSLTTQIPVISEGGEYRVVVESEAGVATELTFIRKHVMNTAGSIFIMVIVGVAAVGLFAGLVYRNKSKTDD